MIVFGFKVYFGLKPGFSVKEKLLLHRKGLHTGNKWDANWRSSQTYTVLQRSINNLTIDDLKSPILCRPTFMSMFLKK